MTLIAMSALLLWAPLSALKWGMQWELFRWIIPVFLFLVVCKIAAADDREMPIVQPLLTLLFCWIFSSMPNGHAEQGTENVQFRKKRNKKNKVCLPDPPTSIPKRKNRKERKKKARVDKDRLKDGDDFSAPSHTPRPMEALSEYTRLNLPKPHLYRGVSGFALSHAQLVENDYPLDSDECPGLVQARSSLPRSETRRRCARCRETFHIVDNVYCADTECVHHLPVKPSPVTGRYACCNADQGSTGCFSSPFHVTAEHCLDDVAFARTRSKRQVRACEAYGVYALDCEMSYTTAGLEVTKVCLVGADGIAVYETHVRPENALLDLNTEYSGVTSEQLTRATTTLADVQAFLLKTLHRDTILVGHALHNDLKALRIIHERVVDTSVLYPNPKNPRLKRSLKSLAKEHLFKDIQAQQHDCVEDARTCLQLVLKKVRYEDCLAPVEDENSNGHLMNDGAAIFPYNGEVVFVPYECRDPCFAYQPAYFGLFYAQ